MISMLQLNDQSKINYLNSNLKLIYMWETQQGPHTTPLNNTLPKENPATDITNDCIHQIQLISQSHAEEIDHEVNQGRLSTQQNFIDSDQRVASSLNRSGSISKLKTVTIVIIAVIITAIVVSVLFIFAAPYMSLFKEKVNPDSSGTGVQLKSASITAPISDDSSNSASLDSCNYKWNYWEGPKFFYDFGYQTLGELTASFQSIIPKTLKAKEIKLTVFIRSINQTPHRDIWTRVRVLNGQEEFRQEIIMAVYPRDTIVSVSQTIVVPVEKTREIRIKTNSKRTNFILASFFIQAWR